MEQGRTSFFSRCRNSPTLEIFTLRMVKEKLSCSALARQAKENMYLGSLGNLRYMYFYIPRAQLFFSCRFPFFSSKSKDNQ